MDAAIISRPVKPPASEDWGYGLAPRFLLQIGGVGCLLSILLIGNAAYQQRRTILIEMQQRGLALIESLASAASLPYLAGDFKSIQYNFYRARQIQDVLSVALFDKNGRLKVSVGHEVSLKELLALPTTVEKTIIKVDKDSLHFLAPFKVLPPSDIGRGAQNLFPRELNFASPHGKNRPKDSLQPQLGYLHLKLSLIRSRRYVQRLVWQSIFATITIISLANLTALLFFRNTIIRPIHNLMAGMAAVRQGKQAVIPEHFGERTEVGTLTATFNAMSQDILKAQEALKSANAELETRVLERTKDLDLANLKLADTIEELRAALNTKSQFVSNISHELRTPLTAIKGYAAIMVNKLDALDKNALRHHVGVIDNEAKRLALIIDNVLELAEIQKKGVRLNYESFSLNALIQRLVEELKNTHTGLNIDAAFAPQIEEIISDQERCRQILMCLLDNAVKYSPKNGAIRIAVEDKAGEAVIAVSDLGPGIPPGQKEKIFEPFFRTQDNVNIKNPGPGLGLTVAKAVVTALGGKIWVHSAGEKGSCFQFTLPHNKRKS